MDSHNIAITYIEDIFLSGKYQDTLKNAFMPFCNMELKAYQSE